jgi:hypothetical protein
MGESYSLEIWLEMLFGGPVSKLFWIKPLGPKFCLAQGDSDLLSCPLMYSNEILTICTVLVVKWTLILADLDFDKVSYCVVLWCSHEI